MKISKLLNKKYFSIILILLFGASAGAEDKPVDIWNIENEKIEKKSIEDNDDISFVFISLTVVFFSIFQISTG